MRMWYLGTLTLSGWYSSRDVTFVIAKVKRLKLTEHGATGPNGLKLITASAVRRATAATYCPVDDAWCESRKCPVAVHHDAPDVVRARCWSDAFPFPIRMRACGCTLVRLMQNVAPSLMTKCWKNFDERSHRMSCRCWGFHDPSAAYIEAEIPSTFQMAGRPLKIAHFTEAGGGTRPHLLHGLLGPHDSQPQAASRSVQAFL